MTKLSNSNGDGWQSALLASILPPCAASLTFLSTLTVAQGAGKAVGVSCATPVLGSVLGGLAVAAASVASAQISLSVQRLCMNGSKKEKREFLSRESAIFHAIFGVLAFKVLGGNWRNVMPSNVMRPGALARASIPARGTKYANEKEGELIKDLYKLFGCHHCGNRRGDSIADHIPPNIIISRQANSRNVTGLLHHVRRLLIRKETGMQRLFPQCVSCMKRQSAALRHGKHALVFHFRQGFPEVGSIV